MPDDKTMTTSQWFLYALLVGAMFAPAFLMYGGLTWTAVGLTVFVAAIPAAVGLAKVAAQLTRKNP